MYPTLKKIDFLSQSTDRFMIFLFAFVNAILLHYFCFRMSIIRLIKFINKKHLNFYSNLNWNFYVSLTGLEIRNSFENNIY